MTTVLILCAGESERWGEYGGTPKHFVRVDNGERLLDRTVRQVRSRLQVTPWIVSWADARYRLPGTRQECIVPQPKRYDVDKFLSSESLWDPDGRTIVLLGDVFFTDAAMDAIVGFEAREWQAFLRPGPAAMIGKQRGELFAQSFWPEHRAEHRAALLHLVDLMSWGVTVLHAAGWQHHKVMCGMADAEISRDAVTARVWGSARRTVVDDFTGDFDVPQDYEDWRRGRGWMSGSVSVG